MSPRRVARVRRAARRAPDVARCGYPSRCWRPGCSRARCWAAGACCRRLRLPCPALNADVRVRLGVREPRRDDVRGLDAGAVARRPLRQARRPAARRRRPSSRWSGSPARSRPRATRCSPPAVLVAVLGIAARRPWRLGRQRRSPPRSRSRRADARRVGARGAAPATGRSTAGQLATARRRRRDQLARAAVVPLAVLPAARAVPAGSIGSRPAAIRCCRSGSPRAGRAFGWLEIKFDAVGVRVLGVLTMAIFAAGAGGARAGAPASTGGCSRSSRAAFAGAPRRPALDRLPRARGPPAGVHPGPLHVPGDRRLRSPWRAGRWGAVRARGAAAGAAVAGLLVFHLLCPRPRAGSVLCVARRSRSPPCFVAGLVALVAIGLDEQVRASRTRSGSCPLRRSPTLPRGDARVPGTDPAAPRARVRPRRRSRSARRRPGPPVRVEVHEAGGTGRRLASGRLEGGYGDVDQAPEHVVPVGRVRRRPARDLPRNDGDRKPVAVRPGRRGVAAHPGIARRRAGRRRLRLHDAHRGAVAARAAAGDRRAGRLFRAAGSRPVVYLVLGAGDPRGAPLLLARGLALAGGERPRARAPAASTRAAPSRSGRAAARPRNGESRSGDSQARTRARDRARRLYRAALAPQPRQPASVPRRGSFCGSQPPAAAAHQQRELRRQQRRSEQRQQRRRVAAQDRRPAVALEQRHLAAPFANS